MRGRGVAVGNVEVPRRCSLANVAPEAVVEEAGALARRLYPRLVPLEHWELRRIGRQRKARLRGFVVADSSVKSVIMGLASSDAKQVHNIGTRRIHCVQDQQSLVARGLVGIGTLSINFCDGQAVVSRLKECDIAGGELMVLVAYCPAATAHIHTVNGDCVVGENLLVELPSGDMVVASIAEQLTVVCPKHEGGYIGAHVVGVIREVLTQLHGPAAV